MTFAQRTFNLTSFSFILFTSNLFGQIQFSGSSQLKYGESKTGFTYSESLINTHIRLDKFTVWTQFEFSQPPELGFYQDGLRKIRLDYTKGPISLKFGDIYEIWGRGLILNQVDDQSIDFDNGIRGLYFSLDKNNIQWNLLTGYSTLWKSAPTYPGYNNYSHNYETNHSVLGTNIDWIRESFELGFSYLQSREKHTLPSWNFPDTVHVAHRILGGRIAYTAPNFDIFMEYADKQSTGYNELDFSRKGSGFYANITSYFQDWTLSADYIRYRFAHLSPDAFSRWDFVNNYGLVLDFQQPAISNLLHSTPLLGRISHQFDFNNNLGYQLDLTGPGLFGSTLFLHYAASSRTHIWESTVDYSWFKKNNDSWLPFESAEGLPYRERYIEVDGYAFNDKLHYIIAASKTTDITDIFQNLYLEENHTFQYKYQEAITFPTSFSLSLSNGMNIDIKWEYQELLRGTWSYSDSLGIVKYDSLKSDFDSFNYETGVYTKRPKQVNHFFSIGLGKAPTWSVALLFDRVSYDDTFDPYAINTETSFEKFLEQFISLENTWAAIELVYNINSNQRLSLMYGSQKGGLLCSNGVCRIIEPFSDGFKLELTSLF
ncbi:MAG: hypothetical protein ISR83_03010 [Candidatus Marinimicrobia bacterium]|nr:hypothetical protein [Candidatus Neomarinimicrobiota bacterium]